MKRNTKTVAKRKSRGPRTTVLYTMENMFSNVIASIYVLVNDKLSLSYTLKLLIKIARAQNDRAILKFYLLQVFLHGGDILMNILEDFKISQTNADKKEII